MKRDWSRRTTFWMVVFAVVIGALFIQASNGLDETNARIECGNEAILAGYDPHICD